jgi:uncharacterized protein YdeI (YjbR/CyaY-like superfamily)
MPADVRAALKAGKVEADYRARPKYQRNDYVGWIARAKQNATREKRIRQMVAELRKGGVYMGMSHAPSAR